MKRLLIIIMIVALVASSAFANGGTDASNSENGEWTPKSPITIILGFSAGGGIDVMCRTVAPFLGEYLGVDVIVQNMPGSSSGIATDYVLDQPADGQTILGTSSSMAAFSTTENSDASYLQLDMLAMPYLCRNVGVVVNSSLGIETMDEFIEYLKTHRTTASTAGVGSMWHIPAAELVSQLGCADNVTFVPYDSGSKTALAVAQGEVDWAAIEKGKLRIEKTRFELTESLKKTAEIFRAKGAKRNIRVTFESCGAVPVFADEKRIRQVISNILENAVRHTPDNGTIEIVVSKIDEKNAKVSVTDSGDGIDPEQAPNLFTSFTQVGDKSRVGRLGLGLSIAKDIVVNHGGRIWAHSEGLGKGASFNFTLPIANS